MRFEEFSFSTKTRSHFLSIFNAKANKLSSLYLYFCVGVSVLVFLVEATIFDRDIFRSEKETEVKRTEI